MGDIAVYCNVQDLSFSLSPNFATPVSNPLRLTQGLDLLVDLYFVTPTGNPASPWTFLDPVGYTSPRINIAQTNQTTPPYLALCTTFTYNAGSGTPYLEGLLNLGTDSIIATLGASPSLKAVFEVDWINGSRQLIIQCECFIGKSVMVAASPAPTPSIDFVQVDPVTNVLISPAASAFYAANPPPSGPATSVPITGVTGLGTGIQDALQVAGNANGGIPILTAGNILPISTSNIVAGSNITLTPGSGVIQIASQNPLSSITGLGAGVQTALALAVGNVAAFATNNLIGIPQGPLTGVRIVCIGDSIVQGINGGNYSWPLYLQNMGLGSSCSIYNLGISGDTEIQVAALYSTSQAYNNTPTANAGTYSPSSLFAAGAYLIDQAGTNDVSVIAGWYNNLSPTGSSNGTNTVTVSSTSGIVAGNYIQSVSRSTFTNNGTNFTDGSLFNVGGFIYRAKSTMAQAYDVQIGVSASASVANLIAAINLSGTAGANYFAGTAQNQYVSAGTISGTTFPVTAVAKGSTGDSVVTTTTDANCSWTGATLTGGSVVPFQTTIVSIGTGNVVVSNAVPSNGSLLFSVSTETVAQFQTAAKSIWTNARTSGYKVVRLGLLPRGLIQDGPLVQAVLAQINTWLSQQSFAGGASPGWDYYFTPATALPNPLDPNTWGVPSSPLQMGLHPNQQGYNTYGAYINQQLLSVLGSDFSIYPFMLNGIPDSWLQTDVAFINKAQTFTATQTFPALRVSLNGGSLIQLGSPFGGNCEVQGWTNGTFTTEASKLQFTAAGAVGLFNLINPCQLTISADGQTINLGGTGLADVIFGGRGCGIHATQIFSPYFQWTCNGGQVWAEGNNNGVYQICASSTGLGSGVKLAISSTAATFNTLILPQQAATAPTYVKGAMYFDTTLNKLRIGGATAWETVTSV